MAVVVEYNVRVATGWVGALLHKLSPVLLARHRPPEVVVSLAGVIIKRKGGPAARRLDAMLEGLAVRPLHGLRLRPCIVFEHRAEL